VVVASERLDALDLDISRRLFSMVGVAVPALQFVALYLNSRRYAVGTKGPVWFLSDAQWQPLLGWVPWLVFGLVGAMLLGRCIHRLRGDEPVRSLGEEPAHVER